MAPESEARATSEILVADVSSAEEALLAPARGRWSTWRTAAGLATAAGLVGLGCATGYIGAAARDATIASSLAKSTGLWFQNGGQSSMGQQCDCGWAGDPTACGHVDSNPCWSSCCQQLHPDIYQQAQQGGFSVGSGGNRPGYGGQPGLYPAPCAYGRDCGQNNRLYGGDRGFGYGRDDDYSSGEDGEDEDYRFGREDEDDDFDGRRDDDFGGRRDDDFGGRRDCRKIRDHREQRRCEREENFGRRLDSQDTTKP